MLVSSSTRHNVTVEEYELSPDDLANVKLPPIGSKHIHKGGNIWEVLRYGNVVVIIGFANLTINQGPTIFMRCLASEGGKNRWTNTKFYEDFEPL